MWLIRLCLSIYSVVLIVTPGHSLGIASHIPSAKKGRPDLPGYPGTNNTVSGAVEQKSEGKEETSYINHQHYENSEKSNFSNAEENLPIWRWACESGQCVKYPLKVEDRDSALSLEACKIFCNDYGVLWPQPTGEVDLGNHLSKINIGKLDLYIIKGGKSDELIKAAFERFKSLVKLAVPKGISEKRNGKSVVVHFVNENPDLTDFSLNFNESYNLNVSSMNNEKVNATISANNFFGLRHGLETLSQLIFYSDTREHLLMVRDVTISDNPVYPYRGILLDTARNYYPVESILRTIDAMAVVKLNSFHWHITDTQSFPFVSKRRPNLSKNGAYASHKVYTKDDIKNIVKYAKVRGVRVVPEFDAPAHVGEGWQDTGLTVCFKAQPWRSFCVEPPCGQLNPIKDEVYDILGDIYTDMAESFDADIFHMGGDEVSEKCWKSSPEIQQFMVQNKWSQDQSGFLKLWDYFQKKAQAKAYDAFGKKLPLVLWTSTLTDYTHVSEYLNKDEYIIQVWTTGLDPQIHGLLEKGYKLIMSNYDALYFDCGFGSWVGAGNNWCSPYIGWKTVYDNSPLRMASKGYSDQILGGEAALWSEQADHGTLDSRLWPRAAAMAERLWAEPATKWHEAEYRMLNVRERLMRMNIQAESIQPEWCYQNEGYCGH